MVTTRWAKKKKIKVKLLNHRLQVKNSLDKLQENVGKKCIKEKRIRIKTHLTQRQQLRTLFSLAKFLIQSFAEHEKIRKQKKKKNIANEMRTNYI